MKVIDLLNMCANEEEVPKEIKCNDLIYEKSKYNATPRGYYRINGGIKLWLLNEIYSLNDEIEIIEDTPKEDKKIKKLNDDNFQCVSNLEASGQSANYFEYGIESEIRDIVDKINEIIDKVNKL